MEPLNKIQNWILQIGGILLLIGAVMPLYSTLLPYAPIVFTIGAIMFATMQMMNRYKGKNLVLRRLRRQQILGALLLLVSAAMMTMWVLQTGPFQKGEWKIVLTIAAVFEVYTSFRIPTILEKENNAKDK